MGRVIHFELPAPDPDRLGRFYTEALGWSVEKFEGPTDYWLVTTGSEDAPGIDGGLIYPGGPITATTNTVAVEDLEDAMGRVRDAGGEVLGEPQEVPDVGRYVYCRDPAGNTFGMLQPEGGSQPA